MEYIIHPCALKECATEVKKPLSIICRSALCEGQLPKSWKEANVTPINKKRSWSFVGNYRPVSLTSVCCKVLEKIVWNVLLNHLLDNGILSDYHHVHGRSCTTQLLKVIDTWTDILDQGGADNSVSGLHKGFWYHSTHTFDYKTGNIWCFGQTSWFDMTVPHWQKSMSWCSRIFLRMDYGATWCGAGVSPQTGTFSELHQRYARNDHINDIYTVNQKTHQNVFCYTVYKTWPIVIEFGTYCPE